jgi:hypothetical protein
MRRTSLLLCCLVATVSANRAGAQTVVDPIRRTNWDLAGATIVNRSTQCGSTIAAYSGPATTINNAVANCPEGQFVLLGAGTFTLSSGILINKDKVTLRGSGPNNTRLLFTGAGGAECFGIGAAVCVSGTDRWYAPGQSELHFTANWTGGYAKGATTLTLSSTSGLSVGSIVTLDQLNDGPDTGHVWVCTTTACSDEGGNSMGRVNRAQQQIVRVTAIKGNTVNVTPGLAMPNWRSSQNPGAMWGSDVVTGTGVENLSINLGGVAVNGVTFFHAYDCWLKNIQISRPRRAHVVYWHGAHITVRDSYFEEGQTHASQSYGIESFVSSDNLVENNIFHRVTSPLMVNGTCSGCVFGYNYSIDNVYAGNFMLPGANPHEGGVDMVLFEGNDQNAFYSDNIHGTRHFVTVFRNYFAGWEPGKQSGTIPIQIAAFGRYHTVIGNVLGRSGYHTNYTWNLSGSNADRSIFKLGEGRDTPNDPLVASTLMRWGNYDVVTGTSRFQPGEVPSGIPLFPNPVPVNQTLPWSLYLSDKPSWWGSRPWPSIGPDVSAGDVPGVEGHVHRIPARLCYENSAKDSTGALVAFNAGNCYAAGRRSATPTPDNIVTIP